MAGGLAKGARAAAAVLPPARGFGSGCVEAALGDAFRHWERLERESRLFAEALAGSSLPAKALEAVAANLCILKSPTVLRLEDGTLYGWEGCRETVGACEGSCTHVWNYAQALPYLFPAIARRMREVDYLYNQQADGAMLTNR